MCVNYTWLFPLTSPGLLQGEGMGGGEHAESYSVSDSVRLIVRSQEYELDGLVVALTAVRADHERIVALLSTGATVQVDNNEALLDRAGVEPPEVALERFAQGQRLLHDHPDLVFHLLLDSGVLADRLHKSVLEEYFHQSEKTSSKVCHSVLP